MNKFWMRAMLALLLLVAFAPGAALAADEAGAASSPLFLNKVGAALGAGLIAIGAGMGIGRFTASAADAIARQPAASDNIKGVVNLPLFLLEGVAIIGLVVCILAIVL